MVFSRWIFSFCVWIYHFDPCKSHYFQEVNFNWTDVGFHLNIFLSRFISEAKIWNIAVKPYKWRTRFECNFWYDFVYSFNGNM